MCKKIALFLIMNLLANSFCKLTFSEWIERRRESEIISNSEIEVFNSTVERLRNKMETDETLPREDLKILNDKITELSAFVSTGVSRSEVQNKLDELFPTYVEYRARSEAHKPKGLIVEMTVSAVITITAGLIAAIASVYYAHRLAIQREEYFRSLPPPPFQRSRVNCSDMDHGCLDNVCWTSCGPRLSHRDYCFTFAPDMTRTSSHSIKVNNQTVRLTFCNNDSECNACWSCATTCTLLDRVSYLN